MDIKKRRFQRLRNGTHNNLAKAGLILVMIFFLTAIFGPWIAPYDPDEQDLGSTLRSPNSKNIFALKKIGS